MYIINFEEIAYHQDEVLYIIKPQEDARWRVMRYSPDGLMRYNNGIAIVDDMPLLSQWIKQKRLAEASLFCL